MPSLKPEELKQELKGGKLRPVYLLWGPETLLVDRALAEIERQALQGAMVAFNCDRFRARDAGAAEVAAAAQTLPMMAERRLVVVKELEAWRVEEQEKLVSYLESPAPSTCLVLVAEEVDARRKMAKAVQAKGAAVEFKHPYPNQLPALIKEMAGTHGKGLETDAVELLIELKGNNLQMLEQELEKLALYVGDQKTITREHVAESVADTKLSVVFEFTDAVGERDAEKALRVFRRMMETGEAPLAVLGMVARHFRLIWKIQALQQERKAPAEIAREAGLNPYILEKTYLPQVRNFRAADLGRQSSAIADLDFALKSSSGDREALFERTVIELCGS
jgi:DNA polymerase III subunit delta